MIVKFFKTGKNGIKSAIKYLLKNPNSEILEGDQKITEQIANSLNYKYKYTSGVLSFKENEKELQKKDIDEIIKEFKKVIFNNNEDDHNIFLVKHNDKNRLEIHFLIPNINLKTMKQFTPFFYKKDLKKFIEFRNFINEKYNLYSPNSHKKLINNKSKYKNNHTINKTTINKKIFELLKQKKLKNRTDIINYFKKNNFQISRIGTNYISVKHPKLKKAIRLKGWIYSEDFTSLKDLKNSWINDIEQQKKDFKTYKTTQKTPSKFQQKINIEKEKNMEKIQELKEMEQKRHQETQNKIKELEQQQKQKIDDEWKEQKEKMGNIVEFSKSEYNNLNITQKQNIKELGNLNYNMKKTLEKLDNMNKNLFSFLNPLNILKEFKLTLYLVSQDILKANKQHDLTQLKEHSKKINLLFEKAKNGDISKEFLKEFSKKGLTKIDLETIQKQQNNINLNLDIEDVKIEITKEQLENAKIEQSKKWKNEREQNENIKNYDRNF